MAVCLLLVATGVTVASGVAGGSEALCSLEMAGLIDGEPFQVGLRAVVEPANVNDSVLVDIPWFVVGTGAVIVVTTVFIDVEAF